MIYENKNFCGEDGTVVQFRDGNLIADNNSIFPGSRKNVHNQILSLIYSMLCITNK